MRPETLAIRCVNQYRARDIVTYLGLRYYLDAACARPDRWSNDVAVDIASHRSSPVYHQSNFYKETLPTGEIEYRELFTPPPNDALAEAALLGECAKLGGPFASRGSVFSYRLATGSERRGVFEPYFIGYRARHQAIAHVCREAPDAAIIYSDLRRFYPSITGEQAANAWGEASTSGRLRPAMARLGDQFVHQHGRLPGNHAGVVTGPMFSHLIGNLVLRQLDEEMEREFPQRYFRYVDDLVIAVKASETSEAARKLQEAVEKLGFHLHPDKRFDVPAGEWLAGEGDLAESEQGFSWAAFIGGMKQLLIYAPEQRPELENRLADAGLRIVPLDYAAATRERDYQASLFERLRHRWYRRRLRQISPATIVADGLALSIIMSRIFEKACGQLNTASGFRRKRWLQRLRYACSRLIYLAPASELPRICDALENVPEVTEYAIIFKALKARDVGSLLRYGNRVAQAAVQPLKALRQKVTCTVSDVDWSAASIEALSVLLMNGVNVALDNESPPPDAPILRFARTASQGLSDGSVAAEYFGELSHLHGPEMPTRHAKMLGSAFDVDESMVFDSELLQTYS